MCNKPKLTWHEVTIVMQPDKILLPLLVIVCKVLELSNLFAMYFFKVQIRMVSFLVLVYSNERVK